MLQTMEIFLLCGFLVVLNYGLNAWGRIKQVQYNSWA